MLRNLFRLSSEKKFWKWFVEHSEELFNFEADQERIFDELSTQLKNIHESLTFEFSSVQNNKREFVISADGIHVGISFCSKTSCCCTENGSLVHSPVSSTERCDEIDKV
jgi:hypothetical protein